MTPRPNILIDDVIEGRPFIHSETWVSTLSKFTDDIWDFNDRDKVRLSAVQQEKLRIHWERYCSPKSDRRLVDHRGAFLPKRMVEELKVFAYLYLKLPTAFSRRGIQSLKPHTLVTTIRVLVCFFSDVVRGYKLIESRDALHGSAICSLTEITLRDLRVAVNESPFANGDVLRKGLKLLADSIMQRTYATGRLQWNAQDIETLEFKSCSKRSDLKNVMPDELFRLLSNGACSDVVGFFRFIGQEPHDETAQPLLPPFADRVSDGKALIADYVELRRRGREYLAKTGKKMTGPSKEAEAFTRKYGVSRKEMFAWLYRVQRAAFTVVGLYTGARYSDLTTFTNQCIRPIGEHYVLMGTAVKHRDIDAPEGVDMWPAIPIMRDAVSCLSHIASATFNPFLFSGSSTVPIGATARPLTLNGFTDAITDYLHEIDSGGRWAHWSINAHQLRHTLAHQLARADVGLMFIALQMKHLHTALNALPPEVTLMYGRLGDLATQKALHADAAHIEAAKELYSPDRPVAGGGAEAFKERRKTYFEGMAAQGWDTDQVIEHLAKQGLPFSSVGIGYCGGRRDTLYKDGTKEPPPCIGSLQCNPATCTKAIITNTHVPAWKKILEQNRKLSADPRMFHAKEPMLAAAKVAEEVLVTLGAIPKVKTI